MKSLYFSHEMWSFSIVNVENTFWGLNRFWHVGQIGFVFCNMWRLINLYWCFQQRGFFFFQEHSQCFSLFFFFFRFNHPCLGCGHAATHWRSRHWNLISTLYRLGARGPRMLPRPLLRLSTSALLCRRRGTVWSPCLSRRWVTRTRKGHFSGEPTRVIWQYGQLSKWENQKHLDWHFSLLLFCIYLSLFFFKLSPLADA